MAHELQSSAFRALGPSVGLICYLCTWIVPIWQLGQELRFDSVARPDAPLSEPKGCVLAVLPMPHAQLVVRGLPAGQRKSRAALLQLDDRPRLRLGEQPDTMLRLETTLGELRLTAEERPHWAKHWHRDRRGLWVKTTVREFTWLDQPPSPAPAKARSLFSRSSKNPEPQPQLDRIEPVWRERTLRWPEWAETIDKDNFGLVATLQLARGLFTRLRYIPPGRFLMGSPETEPERSESELQHWVELSSGLWLAETACTQQEWEAVMGNNPSHFTGAPERPVEQVSWEDCQQFCAKLNQQHPGLGARLPTEAEWEYACRAGTQSPFSFGANISPTELNYDGNYPYANAPKGEYRQQTVAVRSFSPNAWGLYQMHGNVYEWCLDWYGAYAAEEQRDPMGAAEGRNRVIRGGGWQYLARYCRSASRSRNEPGYPGNNLGFRLAAVQPGEPGK